MSGIRSFRPRIGTRLGGPDTKARRLSIWSSSVTSMQVSLGSNINAKSLLYELILYVDEYSSVHIRCGGGGGGGGGGGVRDVKHRATYVIYSPHSLRAHLSPTIRFLFAAFVSSVKSQMPSPFSSVPLHIEDLAINEKAGQQWAVEAHRWITKAEALIPGAYDKYVSLNVRAAMRSRLL